MFVTLLLYSRRVTRYRTELKDTARIAGCIPSEMDSILLIALGLMLVIEGVLPFVAPRLWRDTFRRATELADGQLRFVGLTSMLIGIALIALFK